MRRLIRLTPLVLLAASACLADFPSEDDGPYPCATDDHCADGFACLAGFCARPGTDSGVPTPPEDAGSDSGAGDLADATPIADADVDAEVDAGQVADSGAAEDSGEPADAGCDQTWCGDLCVDLQTTSEHCGVCGRSCLGGACSFGRCLPVEVHRDPSSTPDRIVFAEDTIYWIDRRVSGAVLGRKADGSETTFVVESAVRYPTALVAVDDLVAWSSLDEVSGALNGGVYYERAPFEGAASVAAVDQSNPRGLSVQGSYLYWNSNSPLYVRAHPIGGTIAQNVEARISSGSSYARDVVTSPTEVLWADAQADIWALPLDVATPGSTPRAVVTTAFGETGDLLLHDGTLYWAEDPNALQGEGRLFSATLASGVVDQLVAQVHPDDADQGAVALAFSQGYVYYVTAGLGGRGGGLFRVPHTGGSPEPLFVGAPTDNLRGVAVGAGRVFWTQNDAVYALPEP